MTVLGIDPGCFQSAWVLFDGERVQAHFIESNEAVRDALLDGSHSYMADALVIEQIASYGMPVGREVFDTVFWAGRFYEAARQYASQKTIALMPRREVKLHLCQSARAKDAHVRQALLDRFGGEKVAKGNKASPGPLHGLRKDEWQALALGVVWWDLNHEPVQPRLLTAEVTP